MKFATICFALIFSGVPAARADLVLQERTTFGDEVSTNTTHIRGNEIREDTSGEKTTSRIEDATTGDFITLLHYQKAFRKTSGAKIRTRLENHKKHSGLTNTAPALPEKLIDTGKSEKVNGYDARIFKWPVADGSTMTYWLVKDFPNFERIKPDLATLNKFRSFLGRDLQPDVSKLPGMVVKVEIILNGELIGQTNALIVTDTLLSAKVESVDPAIFKIPKDYTESAISSTSHPLPIEAAPK